MTDSTTSISSLFDDPAVAEGLRRGGCVQTGRWLVRLPHDFGFCGGVLRAVRLLEKALAEHRGHRVWLLGEIIHNHTVNRRFAEAGVTILPEAEFESVFERAVPDDILVVPAFGLPRPLDERLRAFVALGAGFVLDTTCDYVKRVWTFVESMAAEGRTILIHGKPEHPETRATLSRALTAGNAVVFVPDLNAAHVIAAAIRDRALDQVPAALVRQPDRLDAMRLAVANQTTMLFEETRAIEAMVLDAVMACGGSLKTAATLCRATQRRQEAALELLAEGQDVTLVVGGFASSNTAMLHRLACRYGRAFFISDAGAIERRRITHYSPDEGRTLVSEEWLPEAGGRIALLAGASCPPCDIGDVIRALRRFG